MSPLVAALASGKEKYGPIRIDGRKIEQCVRDSGGLDDDDETNAFLELSTKAQNARGGRRDPHRVRVHGRRSWARRPTDVVFKAVRAGFAKGTYGTGCPQQVLLDLTTCEDCVVAPAGRPPPLNL